MLHYRALALVLTLTLVSCGPLEPLPEGPQTVQGILRPAGISNTRRGTHQLYQNGTLLYYVESRTLNLRPYEDLSVTITGTLEHNTDPDSVAVLVATEVVSDVVNDVKLWELPALGIRFSAPKAWIGETEAGSTQFTLSGSTAQILTVYTDEAEPLLPGAQPVLIQNMQAVRSIDEVTGSQTVAIRRAHETLILLFTPKNLLPADADAARQQFLRLLHSIQPLAFSSARSVSSAAKSLGSAMSATSVGTPTYCGGPAGILCPSGQYCAITDSVAKTGVCKMRGTK